MFYEIKNFYIGYVIHNDYIDLFGFAMRKLLLSYPITDLEQMKTLLS